MAAGPEDILQMQVVRFLRYAVPDVVFFHCPNGGRRSIGEARKFKDMGVLPGVPDLCFILPDGRFAGIELKHGKGRQTASQADFQETAQRVGSPYSICRSLAEVETTLRSWGLNLKARAQ